MGRPVSERLVSLDVFRGLTIAGMILVNNPGTWNAVYGPLRHAEWHGWTPTDLIFPFFLFIVGVSMVFSFSVRQQRGASRGELMRHSVRRAAIILAIGLFLSLFPTFELGTARFVGVLQRIAVVYLIAAFIVLYLGRRARIAVTLGLLLGYWAALMLIPVPGYGTGDLSLAGNLAGYIDRAIMVNHLYIKQQFDPEGVLSTLPAIATALLGVFTGEWLRSARSPELKIKGMLLSGAAGLLLGKLWGLWFPINKNLWTSSYVVFTAGFALVILAACYWLIEVRKRERWARPFVWLGMNAIAIYALSSLMADISYRWHVNLGGGEITLKQLVYDQLASVAQPISASLMFALGYVFIFVVLAWLMHRARIFVKV